VFGFEELGIGIRRDVDRRREENHSTREWRRQQEMVPGFFKSLAATHSDVEDKNRATGFSSEHDGAGLGDVTRAARAINREGTIDSFFQAARHHRKSTKAAAGRTTLRCTEPEPFNDLARPLAVEGRGIHHDHALIAVPPDNRNDNAVPERPDAAFARGVDALGVLPAENFVAQRGAK